VLTVLENIRNLLVTRFTMWVNLSFIGTVVLLVLCVDILTR